MMPLLCRIQRQIEAYQESVRGVDQWYSTFFVSVHPDVISFQICTPKVVGV
jgi:hypothetical protein